MTEHTPTPWREWDVMFRYGNDEYPEPHAGDMRLVGSNNICIGVVFGGYASLRECAGNAAFIVKAVNAHDALVEALRGLTEAVRRDCDIRDKGISGYTSARLSDARNALARTDVEDKGGK